MSTTDRKLWQPDPGSPMASGPENDRVRGMFTAHLHGEVSLDRREIPSEEKYGTARGDFARDWVALAEKLGLHVPGEDRRTPLAEGETQEKRKIVAASTRVRQFQEGHNEFDWILVGIESVICDRMGMALPPKAYQTQERLDFGG